MSGPSLRLTPSVRLRDLNSIHNGHDEAEQDMQLPYNSTYNAPGEAEARLSGDAQHSSFLQEEVRAELGRRRSSAPRTRIQPSRYSPEPRAGAEGGADETGDMNWRPRKSSRLAREREIGLQHAERINQRPDRQRTSHQRGSHERGNIKVVLNVLCLIQQPLPYFDR